MDWVYRPSLFSIKRGGPWRDGASPAAMLHCWYSAILRVIPNDIQLCHLRASHPHRVLTDSHLFEELEQGRRAGSQAYSARTGRDYTAMSLFRNRLRRGHGLLVAASRASAYEARSREVVVRPLSSSSSPRVGGTYLDCIASVHRAYGLLNASQPWVTLYMVRWHEPQVWIRDLITCN